MIIYKKKLNKHLILLLHHLMHDKFWSDLKTGMRVGHNVQTLNFILA